MKELLPLVSVFCPTYNHEKYISQCLDGIVMQKKNFEIEVIVQDDASTDYTAKIIKNYASKYNYIIPILYKENQYSKGKNLNDYFFKNAKGKYLALCEGDDYWTDPYKLQKQVDFLELNHKYTGCYHETCILKNEDTSAMEKWHPPLPKFMTAEDTLSVGSPFHTSSFLFTKNAYVEPYFISKVISGDMAIFSIVAAKGLLGKVEGIMSVYRKHDLGITNTESIINNYHSQRIDLINYLNEFHDYKYDKKAQKIIHYHKLAIEGKEVTIPLYSKIFQRVKRVFYGK